ncbi:DEKNAAC102514 [Brettanomyces naardenensis]|uniref:Mitochondrial genome maintenance protein MGM101 n=1 Tax=Brettanomyces naardenensis TaxID=13370 RepID=A0A448YL64_BRENA|nr:DEKNAAC102514 [Brettanomyces naardenensis]
MREAFVGSSGAAKKSDGPTSTPSKKASPDSQTQPPTVDPTINIGFSSGSNLESTAGSGALSAVFGKSMHDFSPPSTLDWSESFHGLGNAPFSKESQNVLSDGIPDNDIEITPDGLLYLPEIKYRRILNKAFGAGAWGLAPRSETLISKNKFGAGGLLTREYGLVIQGRLVSVARGEQAFFSENGVPTATEGCKSNALMRCCKDLGIASELWDPRFIKIFKKKKCENIFVEHIPTKKKKKIWKRKDEDFEYPYKK